MMTEESRQNTDTETSVNSMPAHVASPTALQNAGLTSVQIKSAVPVHSASNAQSC